MTAEQWQREWTHHQDPVMGVTSSRQTATRMGLIAMQQTGPVPGPRRSPAVGTHCHSHTTLGSHPIALQQLVNTASVPCGHECLRSYVSRSGAIQTGLALADSDEKLRPHLVQWRARAGGEGPPKHARGAPQPRAARDICSSDPALTRRLWPATSVPDRSLLCYVFISPLHGTPFSYCCRCCCSTPAWN